MNYSLLSYLAQSQSLVISLYHKNLISDLLSLDHWDLTEKLTIFFDFLGSLAAFKIRLDAATQMTSVNNKDKRPNCLVIDEIDGAPSPTITYLVSLLTGKAKKKSKKGKDSNAAFLQRLVWPQFRSLKVLKLCFLPITSCFDSNVLIWLWLNLVLTKLRPILRKCYIFSVASWMNIYLIY